MADRDQHPSREDEIRRAVFGQVDLQTAELEIVSSIYDGFAAAIVVKGQPRTIALTREYGDAVQLMAMIEQGRSPQSAASEAGAAAGDDRCKFYITVQGADGCYRYDGWSPEGVETMAQAKREAIRGACL